MPPEAALKTRVPKRVTELHDKWLHSQTNIFVDTDTTSEYSPFHWGQNSSHLSSDLQKEGISNVTGYKLQHEQLMIPLRFLLNWTSYTVSLILFTVFPMSSGSWQHLEFEDTWSGFDFRAAPFRRRATCHCSPVSDICFNSPVTHVKTYTYFFTIYFPLTKFLCECFHGLASLKPYGLFWVQHNHFSLPMSCQIVNRVCKITWSINEL